MPANPTSNIGYWGEGETGVPTTDSLDCDILLQPLLCLFSGDIANDNDAEEREEEEEEDTIPGQRIKKLFLVTS